MDILGALARAAQSAGGEGAAAGGWNGEKLEGKSAVGRDLKQLADSNLPGTGDSSGPAAP